MPRRSFAILLAACVTSVSGCLAYMPPDENPVHMKIEWRKTFAEAQADAKRLERPILLVTAAGDLTGFC